MLYLHNKVILFSTIVVVVLLGVGGFYAHKTFTFNKSLDNFTETFFTGNLDSMLAQAEELVEKNPDDVRALLALANVYAQKGSVLYQEEEWANKAIEVSNRVLKIDPRNAEAERLIGYSYEIMEDYSKAQDHYINAINLNDHLDSAMSQLGHAYHLQGDLAKAGEWYQKALDINPENEHALINMARLRFSEGKPDEAESLVQKLFAINKSLTFRADGHQILGAIKESKGDCEGALEQYQQSLEYNNLLPQAWVQKGFMKMYLLGNITDPVQRENEVKDIRSAIDTALSINPNQSSAFLLSMMVAIGDKDYVLSEQIKQDALNAVNLDITLGAKEKEDMKTIIEVMGSTREITKEEFDRLQTN